MKDEQKNIPVFTSEPKTIEDFEQNVLFQFQNVAGWMSAPDYELALLKAKNLVEALEDLIKHTAPAQNLPSKNL